MSGQLIRPRTAAKAETTGPSLDERTGAISAFFVLAFGWIFERTAGSVLPALVLHTSLNARAGILVIVPTATTGESHAVVTGLLVLIALALLITADAEHSVVSGAADEVSRT